MKSLKRFILSLLLSEKERQTIWNSLWFSNHTYNRRGKTKEATAVQLIMNGLEHTLGVTKETFTHAEVQKIVNDVIEEVIKESHKLTLKVVKEQIQKVNKSSVDFELQMGMIIDRDECKNCEVNKECVVYNLIFGDEDKDTKSTEKPKKQASKPSTLTKEEKDRIKSEDDGVNYEK